MDPRDLKSASNYVNQQLASRGLLRGNPIDFAKPSKDPDNPARIINLVHELVQRRDREAEQRENLADTIRVLRNTETKQTSTIETMKEKIAELERKNGHLESQARSMTTTLRTTESSAKSLRDEALRLKSLLAQVRTQAANDVRKRDMQITKMKERLNDTRRGARPAASTIVIKTGDKPVRGTVREYDALGESVQSSTAAAAAAKALSDDTTDFLTTLSQQLADENDNILALVRQCLSTLKAVQGLPDDDHNPQTEEEAEGALNPVVAPPANLESLSMELDTVIGSLQELLNQPDYVPVEELAEKNEELAEKNEEINLLTQRNTVLYEEWKKAIDLLDEWNQGLLNSVQNPEDAEGSGPTSDPTAPMTAPRNRSKGRSKSRLRGLSIASTAGNESEIEVHLLQSQEAVTRSIKRVRATDPQLASEPEPQVARKPEIFEPRPLFQPQPEEPQGQADTKHEQEEAQEEEHEEEHEEEELELEPEQEQEILEDRVIYEEEVMIVRTKSPALSPHPQSQRRKQPTPMPSSSRKTTRRSPHPGSRRGALPVEEPEHIPEPEPMVTVAENVLELKPHSRRQQPVLDSTALASPRRGSRRQPQPEPELPEPELPNLPKPNLPEPEPMVTADEPVSKSYSRLQQLQPAPDPAPVASPHRGSRRQPQPQPEPEVEAVPETEAQAGVEDEPELPKLPEPEPEPIEKPTTRSRRARQSVPKQSSIVASPRRQSRRLLQSAPEPEPEPEVALPELGGEVKPKPRARKPRPSMPETTATPLRQSRRQQQAAQVEETEPETMTGSLKLRIRRPRVAQSPATKESPAKLKLRRPPVTQSPVVAESPAKLKLRRKQPVPVPEANTDTLKPQSRRRSKPPVAEPEPNPEDENEIAVADGPEPQSEHELSDPTSRKRRRSERVKSRPDLATGSPAPAVKKVKRRTSRKKLEIDGDLLLSAAFDA
ncbi:Afadin and alpha-actinin-binding-domain-containing protein [Tricharina praecox]|uniref:Afadin and alpha-actinin-binding-domain-containing protein n=1 Tax=Tricharina praecox TaxID=43433 RepID=UPI00221E9307|nr:Afadin and alpha-actinin-binding-domain-containing protein [Tricharina praecox]KAI5858794.1 Afadin and alpha-actinin-binding-domain-containing protein [Tricharina praecox]